MRELLTGEEEDFLEESDSSGCALKPTPQSMFWAMRDLPVEEAVKHFLICGTTGSGKTIGIQLFLQSIADRFRVGWPCPEQLILFDAKCDCIPMLARLGIRHEDPNVYILNPYDERSAVWSLAEATQTPAMARALAALMVPEERHSTAPFFADAARELVYAAVMALNHFSKDGWTFRDLLCALDSKEHLKAVTGREPRSSRIASRILNDTNHSDAVLSTLATKLGRFEQVAALWHTNRKGRRFSIPDFLSKPGVLVLGNDPVLRDSFWPINAILLKALTHEILRGENTLQPRHWFVLDEFRAMENVDCIHELLNRGRSKGASVLLGIQSIDGLLDVYGENAANDILGLCTSKTFLRAGAPTTASWAERHFGQVRHAEKTYSVTRGTQGVSTSEQSGLRERSMFLASYFLDLPLPRPGGGYVAVCDVPFLGESLIIRRQFDQVLSWCRGSDADVPAVVKREKVADQILTPWSREEEQWFCGSQNGDAAGDEQGRQESESKTNLKLPPRRDFEE